MKLSEIEWRKLGKAHSKITTDVYEHIKEEGYRSGKCKWWTMNALDELNNKLGDLMNRIKHFNPLNIDYIHTAHGADHREENISIVSKLLVRLIDGTKYKLISTC